MARPSAIPRAKWPREKVPKIRLLPNGDRSREEAFGGLDRARKEAPKDRRLHHGARQSDRNGNEDYSQCLRENQRPCEENLRDGIDREVISEDICFYLGPDARVRSGDYQHPQTGQIQAVYFINAYDILTTAHVSDLKADSEMWDAERRAMGDIMMNAEYRASKVYKSRHYYGSSEPNQPRYIMGGLKLR
ncbi:hypothetical protein HYALB_00001612 [Hymenoscyphus albidus]|uniref:Uncharacterized protein n=1 Tax=Hymenoscyphus albidus TaxID=595503 RepID=A0A9N9LEE5_9HELO|nr:hypothetical protein HYALB_00001612 [Hymenoscyphus albidus]